MAKKGYRSRRDFNIEKRSIIKAAKELCYGKDVIRKLQVAETSQQLRKIMMEARKERE